MEILAFLLAVAQQVRDRLLERMDLELGENVLHVVSYRRVADVEVPRDGFQVLILSQALEHLGLPRGERFSSILST